MPDNRKPLKETVDDEMSQDWHMGYYQKSGCTNCGSPEAKAGGFCGAKCKAEYVGEA